MENKNNNKLVMAIIVIISALALVIGFMAIKMTKNDSSKDNNVQDNGDKKDNKGSVSSADLEDDSKITQTICNIDKYKNLSYSSKLDIKKYSNLADYIKEQKNLTADMKAWNLEGEASRALSNEELNEVLENMKSSDIGYSDGVGGVGGYALSIKYTRNGVDKYFSLAYGAVSTNDGNIIKLIEELGNIKNNACSNYTVSLSESQTVIAIRDALFNEIENQ